MNELLNKFLEELAPFRVTIEDKIEESLASFGPKTPLSDAIAYALRNGGKRFRPAIVLMTASSIGGQEEAIDAALALEFFHTASLIADDLPCMDNETTRRGKKALHLAFSESIALLASYALISAGYERIRRSTRSNSILSIALEYAARYTGIEGATGGQFLDLYPPALNEESLKEVIEKKTGALFELSFLFGWLFGGGDLASLPTVREVAYHFGMAFQIIDDFDDLEQDRKEGRKINVPLSLGEKKGAEWLQKELYSFKNALGKLDTKLEVCENLFKEMAPL